MVVDRFDIEIVFVKRHSVVEKLHTVDSADFYVTTKLQKSIES